MAYVCTGCFVKRMLAPLLAFVLGGTMLYGSEVIVAHRGARSLAPENTLAAAEAALGAGATMWEFDVRLTADGELVLMHDATLRRTTDVRRVYPWRFPWHVAQFTLEELRALDAGSWFSERDPFGTIASGEVSSAQAKAYRGEPIPTLTEALRWTRAHGMRAVVELKGASSIFGLSQTSRRLADGTLAVIRELGLEDQTVVSSFDHRLARYLKARAPELTVAALMLAMPLTGPAYLEKLGVDGLMVPVARRPALLSGYRTPMGEAYTVSGHFIYVWGTRYPVPALRTDPAVTGVITSWPQRWTEDHDTTTGNAP